MSTRAQEAVGESKHTASKTGSETYETLYLHNMTQHNDAVDVTSALRNMLPGIRVFYLPSVSAITLSASQADIAKAEALVAELDKPLPVYRLTYAVTDFDGDKRMGTQHFVLIANSGIRTVFKQGTRVPIMTGSYDSDSSKSNTQFQYVDVGLNIETTLEGHESELKLRSKVEQSSIAEEKLNVGLQDPVVRQTVLDGAATLTLGKPMVIGSFDVPGSTRRQEIAVVAERVK